MRSSPRRSPRAASPPPRAALPAALPVEDTTSPPLTYLRAHLLLLLVPLFALRLLALVLLLSLYLLFLLLFSHPTSDPDAPNFRAYPLVVRVSSWVAHLALTTLGFRLRVRGGEHVREAYSTRTATVVVCNHVSYLDVFAVAASCGPYFPVARVDAGKWPFFGHMLQLWGFSGVDRSAAGGGVTARIAERARRTRAWGSHPPTLVFPEGTCTTGDALLRFKSGAFVAGEPVLPVVLRYRTGRLNCGWVWRERPTRAAVYRRWPLDLLHLLRILSSWSNSVEVTVLPPYRPSAAEAADPALYAAGVRRVMAAALGVPSEDCGSMEDARAFYEMRYGGSYKKTK